MSYLVKLQIQLALPRAQRPLTVLSTQLIKERGGIGLFHHRQPVDVLQAVQGREVGKRGTPTAIAVPEQHHRHWRAVHVLSQQ